MKNPYTVIAALEQILQEIKTNNKLTAKMTGHRGGKFLGHEGHKDE